MRARLLAALLLCLAAVWVVPAPAYACSCRQDPAGPEVVQTAPVAFTGTVTDERSLGDTRTYTFAVDRVYRGTVHATQTAQSPVSSAACGLQLSGTGSYLVLGYLDQDRIQVNSCGGTRPLGTVPAELGAGAPPQPGSAPTGLTWTPSSGTATLVIGAAFLVIALVVVRRRSGRAEG